MEDTIIRRHKNVDACPINRLSTNDDGNKTSEEQEKEAFLYMSRMNAAKIFSKYL